MTNLPKAAPQSATAPRAPRLTAAGGGWLAAQNGFGIGGVFMLIACGIAAWGLVTAVAVWRTPWPGGAPIVRAAGPAP